MAAESALAKKLQIRAGHKVLVLDAPPGYLDELGALPDGASLAHRATGTFDVVQLFARNGAELAKRAQHAIAAARPGAVLWICWPKQSSHVPTDLDRDRLWAQLEPLGLRPVASVSIDEVWSALRFRPAGRDDKLRR